MNNKRKVSTTGVFSYNGVKYYIREKELKGQTVEVIRESKHQTLTVKFHKTIAIARQFEIVSYSSIASKAKTKVSLGKYEKIISPQGTFQYKGKTYWVDNHHFQGRTVQIEEIGDKIQVKLRAVPAYKCFAEPVKEE